MSLLVVDQAIVRAECVFAARFEDESPGEKHEAGHPSGTVDDPLRVELGGYLVEMT